jgi:hypothetical protein
MILTKLLNIDIRDAGQNTKTAEMELNKTLIELQQNNAKIIGQPKLFHVDTGKMLYLITYDNTSVKTRTE